MQFGDGDCSERDTPQQFDSLRAIRGGGAASCTTIVEPRSGTSRALRATRSSIELGFAATFAAYQQGSERLRSIIPCRDGTVGLTTSRIFRRSATSAMLTRGRETTAICARFVSGWLIECLNASGPHRSSLSNSYKFGDVYTSKTYALSGRYRHLRGRKIASNI
jgi:hypothetical protein